MGSTFEQQTYNGYTITVTNAVELPIPELAAGFKGIADKEHTGCKNFQFGVEYFGWKDNPEA